jgi:hypothetical protein
MRGWLLLAGLALGCSNTISSATEVTHAPTTDTRLSPTLGIDPAISDAAMTAIVMWEAASGGLYTPDVHLGCDGTESYCIREVPGMMTECLGPDDTGTFNGCCDSSAHEIRISEAMYLDQMASTLTHELGHALGLGHAPSGVMNPHRSDADRHLFCLDAETVDAFSARFGAGPLSGVCYGDDVRQEVLARLDGL